jgi:hypothetical protein
VESDMVPVVSVTIFITDGFTERQRKSIIKGVELWEQATNGAVITHFVGITHLPVSNPFTHDIVVIFKPITSDDPVVKPWDDKMAPGWLIGLADPDEAPDAITVSLVIDRLPDEQHEVWISAHEFGHTLGLHHIDDWDSIMNKMFNQTKFPSRLDINEFCTHYDGCRVVY